jgi:hypothetical protein
VGNADLGFLMPLFDLASKQHDGRSIGDSFETHERSSLGRDDALLDGYWATTMVRTSLTAGLDQAWGLRTVVHSGTVGNHGLWATMRAMLENFSSAACLVATPGRQERMALTLHMWQHDFIERANWEKDRGHAAGRAAAEKKRGRVEAIAAANRVTLPSRWVGYGTLVYRAAVLIGHNHPEHARALWRVASGYAHGRFWPNLQTSTPESARPISGGLTVEMSLDESKYSEIADLTHKVATLAIDRFEQRRRP